MQKRSTLLSLVGAFALLGTMAYGSGFAILEQSPRGLGTSFAGMAAKIDDPGSLYYNPAVSAWFKESRVALGMNIIRSRATFSNDYSTYADGSPLTGNNGGNAGGYSTVPNCYLIQPISERFAFGLGITATSGTATEWDPGWVGRYQAIKTAASTIDFSPSLSWMVADNLSIGAGVDIQYMKQQKTNAVDTASLANHMYQTSYPAGSMDTFVEVNEDSFAIGWNVGMLYQPVEGTRIGLSYRSRIAHSPEGDAKFDVPPALAGALSAIQMLVDTDTESDMDLPPMAALGLYQRLNSNWALLFGLEYTMWDSIDVVTTDFDSYQPDHVARFEWENTWRTSLGFEWYYSEAFTFRFGGAFDQAPCKDSNYRTPRMPDVNRYWASLGMSYKISENLDLDLAYMHLFMEKGNSHYVDENTGETLSGTYVGSADLLSFGIIWSY
jgi:long-chain fatty acid transport protein